VKALRVLQEFFEVAFLFRLSRLLQQGPGGLFVQGYFP